MTDETVSRDETHDSVDSSTGALTPAAVTRRVEIMATLRAWGHDVSQWAEAVMHPDFDKAVATETPSEPDPAAQEAPGDPAAENQAQAEVPPTPALPQ